MVADGDDRFSRVVESRMKLPGEYYDMSALSGRGLRKAQEPREARCAPGLSYGRPAGGMTMRLPAQGPVEQFLPPATLWWRVQIWCGAVIQ